MSRYVGRYHSQHQRRPLHDSECGICVLEGPDEDGMYDLVPSWECPLHGSAVGNTGVLLGGFFSRLLHGSKKDAA